MRPRSTAEASAWAPAGHRPVHSIEAGRTVRRGREQPAIRPVPHRATAPSHRFTVLGRWSPPAPAAGPDLRRNRCLAAPRWEPLDGALHRVGRATFRGATEGQRSRRREIVRREREPYGPVMGARAEMLRARGLIVDGQDEEELVVIRATKSATATLNPCSVGVSP